MNEDGQLMVDLFQITVFLDQGTNVDMVLNRPDLLTD